MERIGDWMQTYTGGAFFPLDPRHDEIRIEDIASALSKMCRFNGHCVKFLSVAEHCVHIANVAPLSLQLTALMHDASEAYIADIVRPVKPHLKGYADIESSLMKIIAERFDFLWPLPEVVKHLDNAMLATERDQNMAQPPRDWLALPEPLNVQLKFWTPAQASYEFTTAFYRYGGSRTC